MISEADAIVWKRRQFSLGIVWLQQWVERNRDPETQSWMLRKMAIYQSSDGRYEEALRLLKRAETVLTEVASFSEVSAIRRYAAQVLVMAGQPQTALEHLENIHNSYPPDRMRDSLIRAEAFLEMKQPNQAHNWLDEAHHDIDTFALEHYRDDFETLSQRL